MFCANHPDKMARRRCYTCKKPICPDCQTIQHHHIFCTDGCADEYSRMKYLERLRYTLPDPEQKRQTRRSASARKREEPDDAPIVNLGGGSETAPLGTTLLGDSAPRRTRWFAPALIALLAIQTVLLTVVLLRQSAMQTRIAELEARLARTAVSQAPAPLQKEDTEVAAHAPAAPTVSTPAPEAEKPIAKPTRQSPAPKPQAAQAPPPRPKPDYSHKQALEVVRSLPMRDIDRGNVQSRRVALTFDGGAHANAAGEILSTLAARNIACTFFLTGRFIEDNPALVRRILADGHEIGNHSYDHPHLTSWGENRRHNTLPNVTREFVQSELLRTEKALRKAAGEEMIKLWRAPYGEINREISGWAQELGYRHVHWTFDRDSRKSLDTLDWVSDPDNANYLSAEEIKAKLLAFEEQSAHGANGGIILMHLGSEREDDPAVSKLGEIIDAFRTRGYEFAPVSRMF